MGQLYRFGVANSDDIWHHASNWCSVSIKKPKQQLGSILFKESLRGVFEWYDCKSKSSWKTLTLSWSKCGSKWIKLSSYENIISFKMEFD